MIEAVAGIDIGGTFTKFGIIDKKGLCLAANSFVTVSYGEVDKFQKHLYDEIQAMMNSLNKKIILKGIGVGAPNGNYRHGTIEYPPNLKWKGIIPFAGKFKKYFPDIPIVLTNDAKAAALGEMFYGGAIEMKNFVVITLGTGLGSAFVIDGQLVYGHDGLAGELGHVNVKPNGRNCRCGNKGCLETYVSATGIKRTFFHLLKLKSGKSNLRNLSFRELTPEMIFNEAKKDDVLAQEAFSITGEILGRKLADAVAITNPQAIFIMGGLAQAGKLIFDPAKQSMEKSLFPIYRGKVKLLPSKLKGRNTAILGAGALAWREHRF